MIRPKVPCTFTWKIEVTDIIVDCSDDETEALQMYEDYKKIHGVEIRLTNNGAIVRHYMPSGTFRQVKEPVKPCDVCHASLWEGVQVHNVDCPVLETKE